MLPAEGGRQGQNGRGQNTANITSGRAVNGRGASMNRPKITTGSPPFLFYCSSRDHLSTTRLVGGWVGGEGEKTETRSSCHEALLSGCKGWNTQTLATRWIQNRVKINVNGQGFLRQSALNTQAGARINSVSLGVRQLTIPRTSACLW